MKKKGKMKNHMMTEKEMGKMMKKPRKKSKKK